MLIYVKVGYVAKKAAANSNTGLQNLAYVLRFLGAGPQP